MGIPGRQEMEASAAAPVIATMPECRSGCASCAPTRGDEAGLEERSPERSQA